MSDKMAVLRMKSLLLGILMPYEACQIPQEKRKKRAFRRTAMDDTRSAVGSPNPNIADRTCTIVAPASDS